MRKRLIAEKNIPIAELSRIIQLLRCLTTSTNDVEILQNGCFCFVVQPDDVTLPAKPSKNILVTWDPSQLKGILNTIDTISLVRFRVPRLSLLLKPAVDLLT